MVFDLILIASATAVACSSIGFFLVLKGTVLMSDAISHAVVLGIVLAYIITESLHPLLLLAGSLAAGIATVFSTELLASCVVESRKEVALALIFPLFFSVAVVLITLYASSVHLDVDMVLLGEILFVPLKRASCFGYDTGPAVLWPLLLIALVNSGCALLFFKPIQYALFEPQSLFLRRNYGNFLYVFLIFATAWTIMISLDIVGSLVTVCLMTVPAATALLFVMPIKTLYLMALVFALLSSAAGVLLGLWIDCSIAGAIAFCSGLLFGGAFLFKIVVKK